MKKKIIFLTAVLLLAVLLFFLKEKGIFLRGTGPSGTPTPEITEPVELKNVWILSSTENSITFFYEGSQRKYSTKGMVQGEISSCVGDLTVVGEEIVALVLKPDKIVAKVLRVDDTSMELEGYGVLSLTEEFKVYRLYDGVAEEPSGKVLVGSVDTEFVLENGKLCASLLVKEPEIESIRVLIGTEGYKGFFHSRVDVAVDCAYRVICGEESSSFEAGEVCSFTKETFEKNGERRVIVPEEGEGKITVQNLKRSGGTPSYRGTLEIEGRENGLLLVNEVTLEEYLYAVLPSEMPSDFETEALKAQAICARSYAYTGLLANRYAEYGAHVDDSVSSQVYNNIGESEASRLAVKDTHGQVLFYGGEVAQCYYFSTSSGHTTSAADVWEHAEEVPYLPGKLHTTEQMAEGDTRWDSGEKVVATTLELQEDGAMHEFLYGKEETYDSRSPWYRWQTFLSLKALSGTVDEVLRTRYSAVPEQILTYEAASDSFVSKEIKEVGTIEQIRVYERGKGGVATKLLLVGSEGVFLVKNEYNIRAVLAPGKMPIERKNGEIVNGATMLPSAFVVLQRGIYEGEPGYLVTGGGYGHGVGLSQYGADAMAEAGFSCEEIIEEYYPGTEIGFIYD